MFPQLEQEEQEQEEFQEEFQNLVIPHRLGCVDDQYSATA